MCGSRYYFENLIKNLGLGFNAKDIQHAKYCFINITHPSARIGADKLFEEMNMEEVFGARLKKGNPVCVDKFAYYYLKRIKLHELCDIRYPWMLQGV